MSAPDVLLVALRDERPVGGRLAAVHDLDCAEVRASLRQSGTRASQFVEREVTTLGALAAAVRRHDAPLVVIAADRVPAVSAALAQELDGAVSLEAFTADRIAGPPPSPWLLGLLPARAAAQVGVRADAAPERLADELAWIERHSPLAQVVPLHGPSAWADEHEARERLDAIERAALSYVRVAPRLDPRTTTVAVAGALARTAAAVVLAVDASASLPDLEPVAELARAAAATDVHVELRLSGDAERDETWIAALARSGLPFDVDGEPPIVPELQRARSFPSRAAVSAEPPHRLRRALEGCSPSASRLVDHALDVIWAHPDDPGRHQDWLRELLAAGSSLAVLRSGPRPVAVEPPAPLQGVTTIGVEPAGANGAATWHVGGELWHVRPYSEAPAGEPMRPLVLTLERREDLGALIADADAADDSGRPPLAFVHPAITIAGLGALSADDPGPRLAQLFVGDDGRVRPAPGAHPIGRLGDPFDVLREAAFERRDRAAPSLPAWLDDDEADALLAERPYLRVLAHLPRALRALAKPSAPGEVRVAGLGGALVYDGPADPRRPLRRLILRAGERYAVCDLRGTRSLVVGRDLAAICEGLHVTGDVDTVAGWLAAARGLSPEAAGRAVSTAVGRLQSVGLLDPAELLPAPVAALEGAHP